MKKLRKFAKKTHKLIQANQFILYLVVFFIAYFVFLYIQATPGFLDPDSFYHLKISKIISQQGPIFDFPWLQYTVLNDFYIDHHFLYHVAAVPFIVVLGDFVGFKLFTVLISSLFILLSYTFLKKYKIKYAEFFALLLVFSPAFLYRASLGKANSFSLIFLFLGIYFIFKKRYLWLFILSFFYVWTYGGFLLLLVMTIFYILANAIYKTWLDQPLWLKLRKYFWPLKITNYTINFFKTIFSKQSFKLFFTVLGGTIAGLIFNPYFPKNIKFYWQQVYEIGIKNYQSIVNVGGEWYPYPMFELMTNTGALVIMAFLALILFISSFKKQKTESIFFFMTSFVFLLLTLKSKRYVEYYIPHLALFTAFSFHFGRDVLIKIKDFIWQEFKPAKYLVFIIFLFLFALMVKDLVITHNSFLQPISFNKYDKISQYLKNNSNEGDVIMHTDWDEFPPLFYQNSKNYYIVGLDPTFMYNYDPQLYQLYADITTAKKSDNLYQAIKENFNAKYFFVESGREQLEKNLQYNSNFTKVYEDEDGKLYKLK